MTPAKRIDERAVNQMLMSNGLGKLDDPGLIPQLGFLVSHVVRSHEQFRELINRCEPSTRPFMYEALKPYVRTFEPKPLDVYIAELADLAERKQLPIVNPDGTLSEYKVPEIHVDRAQRPPDGLCAPSAHADEPAILSEAKTQVEELVEFAAAQKFLTLTCAHCTFYENFAGWNKQACIDKARLSGWRLEGAKAGEPGSPGDGDAAKEVCPGCVKKHWPSLQ